MALRLVGQEVDLYPLLDRRIWALRGPTFRFGPRFVSSLQMVRIDAARREGERAPSFREGGGADTRIASGRAARYRRRLYLGPIDPRDVAPEQLEVIVLPGFGIEDVHNHLEEIQQEPSTRLQALRVTNLDVTGLAHVPEGLREPAELTSAVRGREDKVVGKAAGASEIQKDDVLRVLVFQDLGAIGRKCQRFDGGNSPGEGI